MQLLNR